VTPASYNNPPPATPPPPAPANENINDPTPPAAQPAQPAQRPTPSQYSPVPWPHQQQAAVPPVPRLQQSPALPPPALTPPPDKQGNRYWNPVAPQQPFADQINRYSHEYGIPANLLSNLLRAESNFNPRATGPMTKYGQAEGIAQFIPQTAARYHINPYDPDQGIRGAAEYLRDLYNEKGTWAGAVAAYNGAKSIDVSQYRGSPEGRALIANAVALDGGLVKAGPLVPPPQNYRPVSYTPRGGYPSMFPDRPPSQWGRDTPDMFSGLGAIPHQREIPGVLGALAPFLMIGLALFSKGAALPMLSAFGGYQNARNKRQEEDAKNLRTKYQDQLKELKAKMGIEQVAYAGAGGDQTELRRLATEFGDQPLLAILDNGGDPTALFQQRDKAFQDVSKTNTAEQRLQLAEDEFAARLQYQSSELAFKQAADDRARAAAKEKLDKDKTKLDEIHRKQEQYRKMGVPDPSVAGGSSGGGDASGTDAGGGDAGESGESGGEDGDGGGEQGAVAPPASDTSTASAEPPAATPASAPAAPEQAAAPSDGRDQIVDAQGRPVPVRGDVRPAADTGQPPTAQPAAARSGQEPTELPPGVPRTPFEGWVSDVLNGTTPSELGVDKAILPQIAGAVADKQRMIDTLNAEPAGPDYLDKLRAIDRNFASLADGVSKYQEQLPSTRGKSGRDYANRIQESARKLNPHWTYANYATLQEFRTSFNADKKVGFSMGRAFRLVNATKNLMDDAATMPTGPIPLTTLQQWLATGIAGDPKYNKFASNFRVFATEAMGVATGGAPTVTLTSKLLETLPYGATPAIIRSGIQADVSNSLGAIDSPLQGWHKAFPDEDNPVMFDQNTYNELYRYAHMNAQTGELGSELPQVGTQQTWNGQTHVYTGGDPNNPTNWKTQ